uniref:Uncharacterized protein n=1 Tax=Oryza glumipatula TaxID=40148 RepID=A0A0E0A1K8_9ORYZ
MELGEEQKEREISAKFKDKIIKEMIHKEDSNKSTDQSQIINKSREKKKNQEDPGIITNRKKSMKDNN